MREKEPTTGIIFVRHGKTDFPTNRIYCDDREDPPLNIAGLAQARAAAKLLSTHPIDAIYTSPSSRTRMTATEIAHVVNAPVEEIEALRERKFGIWDGLYFEEIAKDYPDAHSLWRQDPVNYTPEGGETIQILCDRVAAVVDKIIQNHLNKLVVVVSHVGPIRVCLTQALNIPVEWYRQLRIDYCSLTRVDYGARQNNLIFANVTGLLFDK